MACVETGNRREEIAGGDARRGVVEGQGYGRIRKEMGATAGFQTMPGCRKRHQRPQRLPGAAGDRMGRRGAGHALHLHRLRVVHPVQWGHSRFRGRRSRNFPDGSGQDRGKDNPSHPGDPARPYPGASLRHDADHGHCPQTQPAGGGGRLPGMVGRNKRQKSRNFRECGLLQFPDLQEHADGRRRSYHQR